MTNDKVEPPIYAMLRRSGVAGAVGALTGLVISGMIVLWSYSQLSINPLHIPGASADVLGSTFGGQLTQILAVDHTPSLLHLRIQGSMWLVALVVALAISMVSRVNHRDDVHARSGELWAQACLTGAWLAIIMTLASLLPAGIGTSPDGASVRTSVTLFPTVVMAFLVGMAGYAFGIIRKRRSGGLRRLGLRLPQWIRVPAFAVFLHVGILMIAATIVTLLYTITTSFEDLSPATAIRINGLNALMTLTGLGGWGYMDREVLFSQLPDIGSTVTAVTGHPIWMMASTLIVAVVAFLIAAITLHLRRPIGRDQWNGLGITLGLYAIAGLAMILIASTSGYVEDFRATGPSVVGSRDFVTPSWWSLVSVLVIGLGTECAARFLAPKILSLMPGIVRKFGKVPGPDVNP